MGSIISAIRDDIAEYEKLCADYAEPIHMDERGVPDCYGRHATELKERARKRASLFAAGVIDKEHQ
jgi:hypothetical protein